MVRGLDRFRSHFEAFTDHYVLIGGTACTLVMEEAGIDFRATKDLDIVLYVEALNRKFVSAFWDFIEQGGYQNRQKSTGKEVFYRFYGPREKDFPAMLELFSRVPDTLLLDRGHLTPIPTDETNASLSAILLDEQYYHFIHSGKYEIEGLSVVKPSHLIPLKARAFMDLQNQDNVDSKDVKKHRNDILRLSQLLSPAERVEAPVSVQHDIKTFLKHLEQDTSVNLKSLGIKNSSLKNILDLLEGVFRVM